MIAPERTPMSTMMNYSRQMSGNVGRFSTVPMTRTYGVDAPVEPPAPKVQAAIEDPAAQPAAPAVPATAVSGVVGDPNADPAPEGPQLDTSSFSGYATDRLGEIGGARSKMESFGMDRAKSAAMAGLTAGLLGADIPAAVVSGAVPGPMGIAGVTAEGLAHATGVAATKDKISADLDALGYSDSEKRALTESAIADLDTPAQATHALHDPEAVMADPRAEKARQAVTKHTSELDTSMTGMLGRWGKAVMDLFSGAVDTDSKGINQGPDKIGDPSMGMGPGIGNYGAGEAAGLSGMGFGRDPGVGIGDHAAGLAGGLSGRGFGPGGSDASGSSDTGSASGGSGGGAGGGRGMGGAEGFGTGDRGDRDGGGFV